MTKALASSEGKFVHRIGTEYVLRIPVALSVVRVGIVEVLPVIGGWGSLGRCSPGPIVAVVVGHALLEGIRNLRLQTGSVTFLQYSLQSVVVHIAVRSSILHIAEAIGTEGRSFCSRSSHSGKVLPANVGVGNRPVGLEVALLQPLRHHEVSSVLADVPNLEGCVVGNLMLDRKVPLLCNCRLDSWVPSQHGRADKGVAARRRRRSKGIPCGETCSAGHVLRFDLGRSERWVLGKT